MGDIQPILIDGKPTGFVAITGETLQANLRAANLAARTCERSGCTNPKKPGWVICAECLAARDRAVSS